MSYTEEQLNEELMPGYTLRDHLEAEKYLAELNLKATSKGFEPIISKNLSEDAKKDREAFNEARQIERELTDWFYK